MCLEVTRYSLNEINALIMGADIDLNSRAANIALAYNFIPDTAIDGDTIDPDALIWVESPNAIKIDALVFGTAAEILESQEDISAQQAVKRACTQLNVRG